MGLAVRASCAAWVGICLYGTGGGFVSSACAEIFLCWAAAFLAFLILEKIDMIEVGTSCYLKWWQWLRFEGYCASFIHVGLFCRTARSIDCNNNPRLESFTRPDVNNGVAVAGLDDPGNKPWCGSVPGLVP